MSNQLHSELKKEFQLERLILFSDAVFAIAITLLVIEIRVPELPKDGLTDQQLQEALGHLIPKFVGFLISFLIIGLYWTIHHRMFGFVVNYTRKMLWINMIFLLAVVMMPFSTGFYSEYILRLLKTPVIIYAANIIFLGLMNFVLWKYITKPGRNLTEGLSPDEERYFSFRAIAVPCVFILTAMLYLFVNPKLAMFMPPLIPLVMRLIARRYKPRKQNK